MTLLAFLAGVKVGALLMIGWHRWGPWRRRRAWRQFTLAGHPVESIGEIYITDPKYRANRWLGRP